MDVYDYVTRNGKEFFEDKAPREKKGKAYRVVVVLDEATHRRALEESGGKESIPRFLAEFLRENL